MIQNLKNLSLPGVLLAGTFLSHAAFAEDRPNITVALQSMGTAGTLDTSDNGGTAARKYQNMIFEQLIELDLSDPNLSSRPGLATEWKWLNDTTLEVKLRHGVKFHNGDEMKADDVVFSFSDERYGRLPEQVKAREAGQTTFTRADGTKGIVPPAITAANRKSEWPLLKSVEKVDDYTVRFVMEKATLDTEARLARVNYAAIISKRGFQQAKSWADYALHPVATGPYKVVGVDQGSAIHLVSHDDYWGGKPPIAKLDFMVVPEAASRVNGLMSGEYDIVSDLGPDQVPLLKNTEDFDVVGGPVANIRFIALDTNNGPLKNKLVRQALSHSIDRDTIVNSLWGDMTAVPQGFQHKLFGDLFVEDFKSPAYDPELAKKLLAEAGYKGEKITYRVHNDYYPNELTVAQFDLDNLRKIGFNIDFSVIDNPNDPAPDRMMQDLSNTAYFAYPVALLANNCPYGSYNTKTNPKSGMWQNDEFDKLCDVLNTSTDKAEVKKAFARALDIIESEDPAMVVLHQNAILYGKRADIQWKPSAMFVMDFRPGSFLIKK
ncbi:peptide/nickel transport system substrate-binding protein [Rhizobium petrolearium]|uniref:ABC transporter substrate-binding protein n=1 Tax=Neorhizobium petrolearium TaxID=515361 RepID=UPI001AE15AE4|nr:ABC transporter substrate-binding protein [Neorhizobium petrolearium]MBP1847415.1 peptide/nickel transport system substrate-binding protein [Neorhizobium petrolearium]